MEMKIYGRGRENVEDDKRQKTKLSEVNTKQGNHKTNIVCFTRSHDLIKRKLFQ